MADSTTEPHKVKTVAGTRWVSDITCIWCGGNGADGGNKFAGQCPACLGWGKALATGRKRNGELVFG